MTEERKLSEEEQRVWDALSTPYYNTIEEKLSYACKRILVKYIGSPNDITTRAQINADLKSELSKFTSTGEILEYKITCDETNNPDEIVLQEKCNIDVHLKIKNYGNIFQFSFCISN